jgi:glycosyltransferase involved in cell wall biosynthesis
LRVAHLTTVHTSRDIRIFTKECRSLAAAGYSVYLIAPAESSGTIDGVRIIAIQGYVSRLLRMTKGVWAAYRSAVACDAAIYHLHDPELVWAGLLLRLRGREVILDNHEDLVDDILTKPYLPGWLRRLMSVLLSILVTVLRFSFSAFIAATPDIARRFPPGRTIVVRNYPLSSEIESFASVRTDRQPTRALYLGSVTRIRGILEMVEAIGRVCTPANASLRIVGQFESDELYREAQKLSGWQRVEFLSWQPREQLPELVCSSAVGLLLFHPLSAYLRAMPNKLFEYMAAGLPVIVSNFPLWRELVLRTGCGLVVNPRDPEEIAAALTYIFTHEQEATAMGEAGQAAVKSQFRWEPEAERLRNLYDRLSRGRKEFVPGAHSSLHRLG